MLKLILKNLWARRVRNAWLLAELILVTVLTWYITDPLFVLSYNQTLPLGYEPDGLLIAPIRSLPSTAPDYNKEEADSLHTMENMHRMLRKLRDYPGVQNAARLVTFAFPGSGGSSYNTYAYDTLAIPASISYFIPHTGFFETFGFKTFEGKTLGELDNMDYQRNDLVVSADLLQILPKVGRLTGKRLFYNSDDDEKDTTFFSIKGVVEKVRSRNYEQGMYSFFEPQLNVRSKEVWNGGSFLIRLQPDVSEQRFLHDFRTWAYSNLKAGNLYIREVSTYKEQLDYLEYGSGVTNKYRMNIILAVFFLINLALGVTGAFWLQTRSRREEVGIMLSYGAAPGNICRLLMGEAAILASFAWLVGCLIYLQYGLAEGNWYEQGYVVPSLWINNFWLHYIVVSLIVYIIIIVVVLLGVFIPAYKISRIPPTEALRDE